MLSRLSRPFRSGLTQFLRQKSTAAAPAISIGRPSQDVFDREDRFGAHNYHPMPVALCKGQGELYTLIQMVLLHVCTEVEIF